MKEHRPSPDLLLKTLQHEEERTGQGQLKIFFGAAPGVGKTFEMLVAARQKRAEGVDVVAGLVETHGRRETEALLAGFEVIPRREIEYRGATLKEFDLDAALARKPGIILVDELAHSNFPGSRHNKRWQDVLELLAAGINVYTTLNVQHLESLNDVVTHITGVAIRETLPDSVLERADEIELIDLPPDDLLQRLKEGKVYVAELAQRARENFFRRGNLLALRELALLRTAEQVDERMRRYRTEKGVKAIWPAGERIMVCVGPNPRSIHLIRAARRMAAGLRADWIAVHVEAPSKVKPTAEDLRLLAAHMRLAERLGAETATLFGPKASEEILNYARERNVTKILIGKPTHPRWKDKVFGSLLDEIVRESGDIDVYAISGDVGEPISRRIKPAPRPPTATIREWLISLGTVGVCTVIDYLVFPYVTVVDLAMAYLLGIVFVSSRTSRGPSLLAIALSVAAFDFFFVPPSSTFTVHDARYFLTFITMAAVALVISRLARRIREQANAFRQREKRTATLFSLSRAMVHGRGIDRLSAIAVKHISDLFASRAVVLVADEKGMLRAPGKTPETFSPDQKEMSVAQWAFDHRQEAGLWTDNLPGAEALYLPLITPARTVGVLGLQPGPAIEGLDNEQLHVLQSFANHIALAIDRALLSDETRKMGDGGEAAR